jgi:hypothetical protein
VREAPWRTLVRTLCDAGYESPYLDRLRSRLDVAEAQRTLEAEIVREMAAALGRAEDKVNAALLRLELAGEALAAARSLDDRRAGVREWNARRDDALRARWELVIQRESVGLVRNDVLDSLYPIPARKPAPG